MLEEFDAVCTAQKQFLDQSRKRKYILEPDVICLVMPRRDDDVTVEWAYPSTDQ